MGLKRLSVLKDDKAGSILLEVVISLILISLLALTFMSMYVFASRVNARSQRVTDTTYAAQNMLEELYSLSVNQSFDESLNELRSIISSCQVTQESPDLYKVTGEYGKYGVEITLQKIRDNMYNSIVKAYTLSSSLHQETTMQNLFIWNTEADSGEDENENGGDTGGGDTGDEEDEDEGDEDDNGPEQELKIVDIKRIDTYEQGNKVRFNIRIYLSNGAEHDHNNKQEFEFKKNQNKTEYIQGTIQLGSGYIDYEIKIIVKNRSIDLELVHQTSR